MCALRDKAITAIWFEFRHDRAGLHPIITAGIAHENFCSGPQFPMVASAGADAVPVPALRLHPGQGIIMVASGWSCSPASGRRSRWR